MRTALLLLFSLSVGNTVAQDSHQLNRGAPTQTQKVRPVTDSEDYKNELFNSEDLRALGAGTSLKLNKGFPILVPANSQKVVLGHTDSEKNGTNWDYTSEHRAHRRQRIVQCFLIMREADVETRILEVGREIVIGGGAPTKTKVGDAFVIEIPVESPASIQSIQCNGSIRVIRTPTNEEFYFNRPRVNLAERPTHILIPTNPLNHDLREIFKKYGTIEEAKPTPIP